MLHWGRHQQAFLHVNDAAEDHADDAQVVGFAVLDSNESHLHKNAAGERMDAAKTEADTGIAALAAGHVSEGMKALCLLSLHFQAKPKHSLHTTTDELLRRIIASAAASTATGRSPPPSGCASHPPLPQQRAGGNIASAGTWYWLPVMGCLAPSNVGG